MCGITGVIGRQPHDAILRRMAQALAHRGPDGSGIVVGSNFGFGHRRLAIVDLSPEGAQPMRYRDRYTMVYNGEVYNHFELRDELRALGHTFTGHSDSEVILAAYAEWGAQCLSRFNGMWALCIQDAANGRFFLARDRFGIKPLHLVRVGDALLFASEVKSFMYYPGFKLSMVPEEAEAFLAGGPREWREETLFDGVTRLPAGHYLEGTAQDLIAGARPQRYWELQANPSVEPYNEARARTYAARYYDLLKDAVRLRLRADVPVGSALSGGLDSSSVVFLVNQVLREQGKDVGDQNTFSCIYRDPQAAHCDESRFIERLSGDLAVRNHQIEPAAEDVPEQLTQLLRHLESPPHSTILSAWYTYKLTSAQGIKVTLDGQGADEQLGGYMGYVNSFLTSLSVGDFMREALAFWRNRQARKHVLAAAVLMILRPVIGRKGVEAFGSRLFGGRFYTNLNERLAADVATNLQNLFHYCDRTSMGWGVESRLPFMDYRLVEFLASVPASYKLHRGWTKYLARLAFDGKLPDEIVWRQDKMGWPIPEDYWFRGPLKDWMHRTIGGAEVVRTRASSDSFARAICTKVGLNSAIRQVNLAITIKNLEIKDFGFTKEPQSSNGEIDVS